MKTSFFVRCATNLCNFVWGIPQSHRMSTSAGVPFYPRACDPQNYSCTPLCCGVIYRFPFSPFNSSHDARTGGLVDVWINGGHAPSKSYQGLFHMCPEVSDVAQISDVCVSPQAKCSTFNRCFQCGVTEFHFPLIRSGVYHPPYEHWPTGSPRFFPPDLKCICNAARWHEPIESRRAHSLASNHIQPPPKSTRP